MNLATFLIAALVAAAFIAIVAVAIRNRKKGKSSCACGGCQGCAMQGSCHSAP